MGLGQLFGNSDFGRIPPFPKSDMRDAHCNWTVQVLSWSPACLLGVWHSGKCYTEGVHIASPTRNPSTASWWGFLGRWHFTHIVTLVARESSTSSVTPQEKLWEACAWSPLDLTPLAYSLGSVFFVSFYCKNHRCECDYVVSVWVTLVNH